MEDMTTFPDYDFGWSWVDNSPSGEPNASPPKDETAGTAKPDPPFTLGVVVEDIGAGVKKAGGAVTGAVGGAFSAVTGSIKGAYWSLIGGVAIIGIIAIVALGASSRFMGKMEGR